jgi:hypothetical protein
MIEYELSTPNGVKHKSGDAADLYVHLRLGA